MRKGLEQRLCGRHQTRVHSEPFKVASQSALKCYDLIVLSYLLISRSEFCLDSPEKVNRSLVVLCCIHTFEPNYCRDNVKA